MALECLADGAPIHEKELLDELHIRTVELGKTKWLGLPFRAIGSLSDLRASRLKTFADETREALLDNAAQHLDDQDVLALKVSAKVSDLRDSVHPTEGECIELLLEQLQGSDMPPVRALAASALMLFVRSRRTVRRALTQAFSIESDPEVRAGIAAALGPAVGQREVKRTLLKGFRTEPDPGVRSGCAVGLAAAALEDQDLRAEFLSVLSTHSDASWRFASVWGLGLCLEGDHEIQQVLQDRLEDAKEDEEVRMACLLILEKSLAIRSGALEFVADLLSDSANPALSQAAAQTLAGIAGAGQVKWSRLPIEKIEQVLISIEDPCRHEYAALCSLVDGRERRKFVLAREKRIENALSEFDARLEVVFIFGSAAKLEQDRESDLDLMVIGDVSLRDLTPALKRLELELGRQMNAVIYSREEWSSRLEEKNPFAMNVWNGEKIFVKGGQHELAAVAR
ncbi:MAG: HEAT repeat domain-containing protein [Planctomycetes bacterium]|nr:HEAT repeat domain-containing protein [Planctomycetota bacterium]